jgi:AraC family transcriptional activator of pyochelin receptor
MMLEDYVPGAAGENPRFTAGLFRSVLAGPGQSLSDAFEKLEHAPLFQSMSRHTKRGLLGGRIALHSHEGHGYWDLTRVRNDIFVVIANFTYNNTRMEFVPGDGLVQFNFKLCGDMTLAVNATQALRWDRPSLLVWVQPTGVDISEWTAPRAHERYVAISVRPEFFCEHFLSAGSDTNSKQIERFLFNKNNKLDFRQIPLSSQSFDLVSRLLNNPFIGNLALVNTEGVALELLCCAADSLLSVDNEDCEVQTKQAFSRLYTARNVLTRTFAPVPSVGELARYIGMSERSLIRGFKLVFKETLFEFSLRCRMRHALSLLCDRNWSIARTSEAVGYAHPTSFATAFRRHYGMPPIAVKRRKDL